MAFYYIVKALGLPAGLRDRLPRADLLGGAGDGARRRSAARVRGRGPRAPSTSTPPRSSVRSRPRRGPWCRRTSTACPATWTRSSHVARRHGLAVIEDCAHALGATYHGQPVGTLGDAALFSFQVLKPLNTFGGGAAYTRHDGLGRRLARDRAAPSPGRPRSASCERLRARAGGARAHAAVRLQRHRLPDPVGGLVPAGASRRVPLGEGAAAVARCPPGTRSATATCRPPSAWPALDLLDEWTETTRAHARFMTSALADCPASRCRPSPPTACTCTTSTASTLPIATRVVRRSLRAGLDVEYHHMDVCPDLPLFSALARRGAGRPAHDGRRCSSRSTPA